MTRFVVTNKQADPVRVVVEPWGVSVTLLPDQSTGVTSSESMIGHVNVIVSLEQIELWAEGDPDLELRLDPR